MKPFRVLGNDILISDNSYDLDAAGRYIPDKIQALNAKIDELLARRKKQRGGKIAITQKEFEELAPLVEGLPGITTAGGSASNTLRTLAGLLGEDNIAVKFIGVAENGKDSTIVRTALDRAHITLIPNPDDPRIIQQNPQLAFSFVFNENGGKQRRTIITYPGNAKDILHPKNAVTNSMISIPDLINDTDAIFLQGSSWGKFEHGLPDALFGMATGSGRNIHDKELWLALPTQAEFSEEIGPKDYERLLKISDVVLGNDVELQRIYQVNTIRDAVAMLQEDLRQQPKQRQKDGFPARDNGKEPKAFITCGENAAFAVSPGEILEVPVFPPAQQEIYLLGAGDNAFAGFLAGHIAGLSLYDSARLGQAVAREKLSYIGSCMKDPRYQMRNSDLPGIRELWKQLQLRISPGYYDSHTINIGSLADLAPPIDRPIIKRLGGTVAWFDILEHQRSNIVGNREQKESFLHLEIIWNPPPSEFRDSDKLHDIFQSFIMSKGIGMENKSIAINGFSCDCDASQKLKLEDAMRELRNMGKQRARSNALA